MAIEIVDFPMKHGDFPMKHGDFPMKHWIFHSSGMLWDILPEGKFLNYIKGRQGRHWDFLGVVVLISIGTRILPFSFG